MDLHLLLRCLDASGVCGISKILSLLSVLLLQMVVVGAILIPWELDQNEFESLHVIPPIIAVLVSGMASVGMVMSGDKFWISVPQIILSIAGCAVIMAFSCTSVWPLSFLVASVVELSVVESAVALIRLKL